MSAPNIRTIGNKLILKQRVKENRTSGGLIIPETASSNEMDAEIIAISSEIAEQTDLIVGEIVRVRKTYLAETEVDGEKLLQGSIESIVYVYNEA